MTIGHTEMLWAISPADLIQILYFHRPTSVFSKFQVRAGKSDIGFCQALHQAKVIENVKQLIVVSVQIYEADYTTNKKSRLNRAAFSYLVVRAKS